VSSGGSIVCHGDEMDTAGSVSLLFDIEYTGVDGTSGVTTDIVPHDITLDVDEVYVENPVNSLTTTSPKPVVIVRDIGQAPHIVVNTYGSGKIVVIADDDMQDGAIEEADNRLLSNQVFDWLAKPVFDWISVAPTSFEVEPGGSQDVVVTFKAGNLRNDDYCAKLLIYSDAPDENPVTVPVHMEVYGLFVLLDTSHGFASGHNPVGDETFFSGLKDITENNGWRMIADAEFDLSGISTLFLAIPAEEYIPEELTKIQTFVEEGGNLVICGEWGGRFGCQYLNEVSSTLGITINQDIVFDDTDNDQGNDYWPLISNFDETHPIVTRTAPPYTNVEQTTLYTGASLSVEEGVTVIATTDEDGYAALLPAGIDALALGGAAESLTLQPGEILPGQPIVMAAATPGEGKVFVVGDTNIWGNDTGSGIGIGNYDNRQLADNVLVWMAPGYIPIPGDVSGNGTISALDAAMILQHLVGLITLPSDAQALADVSDDGTISAFDASLILERVVGLIDKLPTEDAKTASPSQYDQPYRISLANVQAKPAEHVIIPLTFGGAGALVKSLTPLAYGGEFTVEFDAGILEFVNLTVANELANLEHNVIDNKIHFAFAGGKTNNLQNSNITNLEFAVLYDTAIGETKLRITAAKVNESKNITAVDGIVNILPLRTALHQNYPNPFNPETWIPYQLADAADVTVEIYSITGDLIKSINLGRKVAGSYMTKKKAVCWDGRNELGEKVASGVYFVSLRVGKFRATRRMVLVK